MFARARGPIFGAAAVLVILLNVLLQPPWRTGMPEMSLDPSWQMVVLHGFAHGWQFGEDLVFTYGPLGFAMASQFSPTLYGISLTFWIVFYGLFAGALCTLYRHARPIELLSLLLIVVVTLLSWAHDGIWFAACFIVFLLARRGERTATALGAALTVLLAATALMKTTSLLLALPAIVLTDIERYVRFKSPPAFAILFIATFVVAYVAAGQTPGALGTYLVNAFEVSRGYGEAMHTYASVRELGVFTLAAGLTFAAVAITETQDKTRPQALIAAALTAGVLFVAAKAGFVRHDTGHALIPWMALMLVAAAYLGEISPAPARLPKTLLAVSGGLSLILCCATFVTAAREAGRVEPAGEILARGITEQFRYDIPVAANVLFGDQIDQYKAAYEAALGEIRARHPLPPMDGTVDIFGVNQALVLAAGADYRPRPVFQSYSAYTPRLIALNRTALAGPRAPDNILFEIDTVDNRYPSLDDGALWPDILRRYDVTRFEGGYALLKRRTMPRTVTLTDAHQATIRFGETLDVAPWADGLLWVEMDFQSTLLGRLRSFLFKPPLLMIAVTTDAGNTQTFRLVPGMTRGGFLLSPLIETTDQFALLPAREESVIKFSVLAVGRPAGAFTDAIKVRLKRLDVSGENENPAMLDSTAMAQMRTLRVLVASAGAVPGQAKPPIYPDGKALAHAPSRLALPVPAEASRLTFGYGILEGAWADGREGDGACFRVSAGEAVLHEACLDPKRIADDRTQKTITAALPAGASQVVFEILPRANTDWDWTYWSAVAFP